MSQEKKEVKFPFQGLDLEDKTPRNILLEECRERIFFIIGFFIIYILGLITNIFSNSGFNLYITILGSAYFVFNVLVWFFTKKAEAISPAFHQVPLLVDFFAIWNVIFCTGQLESRFFIFLYIMLFAISMRYSKKLAIRYSILAVLIVLSFIILEQIEQTLTPVLLFNGFLILISIIVVALITIYLANSYKNVLEKLRNKENQLEEILNEMRYQQTEIEETNINMNRIIQKQKHTEKNLNKKIKELSLILEITHQLNSVLDIEELINLFIEKVKNMLPYDDIEIYVLNEDDLTYRCVKEFGSLKVDFFSRDNVLVTNDYIKEIISSKDSFLVKNVQKSRIVLNKMIKGKTIKSMVYSPLFLSDKLIGFIKLAFFRSHKMIKEFLPVLSILTNIFAQAIENNLLYESQKMLNSKFQTEMKLAHDIQLKIIPDSFPQSREFEYGAQYIPSEQIGGDYYDFIKLNNKKLGFIISDVSGHGVGAAMVMSMVKSFVFNYFIDIESPKKALELINVEIKKYILEEDYLTILYGILDMETGEFVYSNGGHAQPFYYSFKNDKLKNLEVTGSLIGIFDSVSLEEKTVHLDKGDFLLFYTDGVIENRNQFDESFNKARFHDLITNSKFLDAESICNTIIDSHLAFVGDLKLKDDISLVVIKRLPEILFKRRWEIASDIKNIKGLVKEFEEIFTSEKIFEKDIYNLKLLLTESIINAIIHGNKEKKEKIVSIDIKITSGSFTAKISDEGKGFNYQEFLTRDSLVETLHEESGRGLHLILSLADNVTFNKKGNAITLTKKISRKI